ncbi:MULTISPECIES: preprotein translocase subunit SecY [unclassified Rhizobium]|uniref:preprotein translocase subunit SecY n=1 Tax=unclassified Rhizobium TaxID=2613769 RepID=UPI001C8334C7|nr:MULTISPECIES: preprotein translocase subunit SecY [unclassified Rhizobium]MBX5166944.1 preprotein translocase subunit SecY [Rhizobium sp. NZLR4b]MBX5211091.1 preprotein translocase subunit SecY [Rhizobium sp. NZLR11]
MDSRQTVITFAFVGIVYVLGLHVPLPGIDLDAFTGQSYTVDSGMLSRVSILALGLMPLYAALGLAEIARLIGFPWLKRKDKQSGNIGPGAVVVVIALVVAAMQACGISGGLAATPLVDDEVTNFTILTIASYMGATAFTIFLSDRIRIAGLRDGFWPVYSIPILLGLPNNVIMSVEMTRTGAVPSTQWLIVAVYLVMSVAAVVVTSVLWRSACRETGVVEGEAVEPKEILIWPPVLAITAAVYVLGVIAFIAPSLAAAAQGATLQVIVLAIASILIPLVVFSYIRRLKVANIRLIVIAIIIALIQILLLVFGAIVSAFIQLPVSPGAIGVIVLTVTALGLQDRDKVKVEGSLRPHVSAQTDS